MGGMCYILDGMYCSRQVLEQTLLQIIYRQGYILCLLSFTSELVTL